MQFFDKVVVKCTSGSGGDGCVAARREKYVPYGGPAGGNGGRGGSIILVGDKQLSTLATLHAMKHIRAQSGEGGKIKEQYGKDAEDTIIHVPVGTSVRDMQTGQIVLQIIEEGQTEVLLAGGRGGVGNMHFSNSVTQYANFGLLGEPGQMKEFEFELQLLADVALLGFPSVGKTSLLNCVSAAAAKTAAYHFTTLIPNLGVVDRIEPSFVLIDIPGLIEGAAGGKGLGNEFLRHVMKARIRSFVFDLSSYEKGITDMMHIFEEVATYMDTVVYKDRTVQHSRSIQKSGFLWQIIDVVTQEVLLIKQCVFVGNKSDLVQDEEVITELKQLLAETVTTYIGSQEIKKLIPLVFIVSAGSQQGIQEWLQYIRDVLPHAPITLGGDEGMLMDDAQKQMRTRTQIDQLLVKDITDTKLDWLIHNDYLEEKEKKYVYVREVYHPEMSYLTFVLPWGNDEAELWYWRVLEKKQILKHLERAGVKKGDVFLITSPYAGKEDRWVRWV